MNQEFGSGYAHVLARDLVIAELENRTVAEALAAGVPLREAWLAICRMQDVPEERRHGAFLLRSEPPRG